MNEEILKKLGYNNIALEMLLKREAQISPEDIIMPGEKPRLNTDSSLRTIRKIVRRLCRNPFTKVLPFNC